MRECSGDRNAEPEVDLSNGSVLRTAGLGAKRSERRLSARSCQIIIWDFGQDKRPRKLSTLQRGCFSADMGEPYLIMMGTAGQLEPVFAPEAGGLDRTISSIVLWRSTLEAWAKENSAASDAGLKTGKTRFQFAFQRLSGVRQVGEYALLIKYAHQFAGAPRQGWHC